MSADTGFGFYTLIGQTPVPCHDALEWARWFESADRRVALTRIGPFRVSTIFLGLDHSFGGGPPLLFETMTFVDGPHDVADFEGRNEKDGRWTSWKAAEAGHQAAVDWLKKHYCAPGEEPVHLHEPVQQHEPPA